MKTTTKFLMIIFLAFVLILLSQAMGASEAHAGKTVCSGGTCYFVACSNDSECGTNHYLGNKQCEGNDIYQNYISYDCDNPGTASSSCIKTTEYKEISSCSNSQTCNYGSCVQNSSQPTNNNYTGHSYLKCVGNSVYWFDSNDDQNDLYHSCSSSQFCSSNTCVNSTYTPPSYTPPSYTPPSYNSTSYASHFFKGCVNDVSYWYDSFGSRQDAYQNCKLTDQTCSNGQCVGTAYTPTSTPNYEPMPEQEDPYSLHYVTKCYQDGIFWYDSKDELQSLFQSCQDDNQCTLDTCSDGRCGHELKCDGSTCAIDSEDYLKQCISTAAASENPFGGFLKRWYIWIFLAFVLVFLFIMVFRRLSAKV